MGMNTYTYIGPYFSIEFSENLENSSLNEKSREIIKIISAFQESKELDERLFFPHWDLKEAVSRRNVVALLNKSGLSRKEMRQRYQSIEIEEGASECAYNLDYGGCLLGLGRFELDNYWLDSHIEEVLVKQLQELLGDEKSVSLRTRYGVVVYVQ